MNDFKNNLLNKIKAENVSMRPRWHFVLQTFLLLLGVVLVALIAVYLLSFVVFTLRQSGVLFAPQFGWHGIVLFVVSSPWLLISMLGIFLLLLYVLVSRYSFSYQKPLVYSMIGVVLFVVAVSSLIQHYNVHNRVQAFAERNNVPGLRPLYEGRAEQRPAGVVQGKVIDVSADYFVLETDRLETLQVQINIQTRKPPQFTVEVGSEVMVFGHREGDEVTAFGLRPIPTGHSMSPRGNRLELRPSN